MITLDTSGLIAYIGTQDRHHEAVRSAMNADPGPYFVPAGALAEMAFMIERDFPPNVEQAFLADLIDEAYSLHWDNRDLIRIQELTERYQDLPLGFVDAAVVACAERHGGRVLSLDRRHFEVIARGEKSITLLPERA